MPAPNLNELTQAAHGISLVRKDGLHAGDWIIIRTVRSEYRLKTLADGRYEVRGGWFDRNGFSPASISVTGCTWGGSAIMTSVVAACGLRVEFGNRLTTSPVRKVVVIPGALLN